MGAAGARGLAGVAVLGADEDLAEAVAAGDPRLGSALIVDARPPEERGSFVWPGALEIPYDYLSPTPPEAVQRIAASGAPRVVVFGDGGDPDSGEQLARELAGKGLRNVCFVRGGAPALEKARGAAADGGEGGEGEGGDGQGASGREGGP